MSAEDFDLLSAANAPSRARNITKTSAPGPHEPILTDRTRRNGGNKAVPGAFSTFEDNSNTVDLKEYDDEDRDYKAGPNAFSNFQDTSNTMGFEEYDEDGSSDFAGIAEGRRLVIAIDYGTTFTGT
jgi:hypothetical protein